MPNLVPLLARIFLSAIFLKSGITKIFNFAGTQQYMAKYLTVLSLPFIRFLLMIAIIVLLLGGLSILLGYKARWGSLGLILFLIPATLIFHTNFSDPMQEIQFLKNLAIIGGLCMINFAGAGPISIDQRLSSRRSKYYSRYL